MHYATKFAAVAALCATIGPALARDLSLAEVEQRVLLANRDVIAARRGVDAAGAQILQADVRPNPIVSLNSASISRSSGIGAGPWADKRIDTVLRIDQTIERGSKRELRLDAAHGIERAAQNDLRDTLRLQLYTARVAYVDLQYAQAKVDLLEETVQLFGRTLAAAQIRLKAGDIAAADVARVQVDYERAEGDLLLARNELRGARHTLAYLIAAEPDAETLDASDDWLKVTDDEVDLTGDKLAAEVNRRPDVQAARARVEAAEKLRDLARSQRTRDITVGAQVEHYPGNDPMNTVGFGLAVPLFLGNDYSGDIRRAEVDRYSALDALEKARAVATAEIERTTADLRATRERLARYEGTLIKAAQRSADAAEFAFQRGASSVLDVLDARRTLRAVRLETLAAHADLAKAWYAWSASRQSGDSLPSPVAPKDSPRDMPIDGQH